MKTIPNEGLIHLHDILGQSYLLATNHQALADVMSTNVYDFEKPWRARNFIARILGFGLVMSEGASHKKQRRALTPAFNIKKIRAMYSLMWDKTNQLLEEMEKELRLSPMQGTNLADGEGTLEMGVWGRYVLSYSLWPNVCMNFWVPW
jgi:cytochrome P450